MFTWLPGNSLALLKRSQFLLLFLASKHNRVKVFEIIEKKKN